MSEILPYTPTLNGESFERKNYKKGDFESIRPEGKNYVITVKGKEGLVNKDLTEILTPVYDSIKAQVDGNYILQRNGEYGLSLSNGILLINHCIEIKYLDIIEKESVERFSFRLKNKIIQGINDNTLQELLGYIDNEFSEEGKKDSKYKKLIDLIKSIKNGDLTKVINFVTSEKDFINKCIKEQKVPGYRYIVMNGKAQEFGEIKISRGSY